MEFTLSRSGARVALGATVAAGTMALHFYGDIIFNNDYDGPEQELEENLK